MKVVVGSYLCCCYDFPQVVNLSLVRMLPLLDIH